MSDEPESLKLYPVQALHIGLRELHIKANQAPDDSVGIAESDYELAVGHSDYDPEAKLINILISIEAGRRDEQTDEKMTDHAEEQDAPPFHLRIQMLGVFQVDDSLFPAERIYEWAKRNSLYIMYPYLREHIYALTARAGFKPMLLPLVEVPLFRIETPITPVSEMPATQPQV